MKLFNEIAFAVATIWQEARGEPFDGKVAVAEVIRNRMDRRYASDGTIIGTVLQPYQFSGWNTKDPNRILSLRLDDVDPIVRECKRAWNDAVPGGSRLIGDAVLYLNSHVLPTLPVWADPSKLVVVIGNHSFYRA